MKKIYFCCGEKYSDRVRQGMCGGFGYIDDFIEWLYGKKNRDFFSDFTDKEAIDYLRKNAGKRLEEYNGFTGCWSIKKEIK